MKRTASVVGLAVLLVVIVVLQTKPGPTRLDVSIGAPAQALSPDPISSAAAEAQAEGQRIEWYAAEERVRVAEAARIIEEQRAAEAAAREAERARAAAATPPSLAAVAPRVEYGASLYPCGGDLPPCWVAQQESGGSYSAFNANGCTLNGRSGCYGKWQFGWFWGGKLGLPLDLSTATPEQQDNAARILWNGGRGCSNWSAC